MTPYQAARAAFDVYAGMRAGELPGDTWSALQVRATRWQVAQFGALPEEHAALGMSEELGELATALFMLLSESVGRVSHAVLKHRQGIRRLGSREAVREAVADALADILIYATQLATVMRLDLGTLYRETLEGVMRREWATRPEDGGMVP